MELQFPADLSEGVNTRQPLNNDEREELVATSLETRIAMRAAGLDRSTGRVHLDVPEIPLGRQPRKGTLLKPPAPDATGGTIKLVRGVWVAKYDPALAVRERKKPRSQRKVNHSDPVFDVDWADPIAALDAPWIHSELMRGATKGIPSLDFGDLIFVMRTEHLKSDVPQLSRRCIIGVWWFESMFAEWGYDRRGAIRWYLSASTFPLRLFKFPVPIKEMGDIDADFKEVSAFKDRSRSTFLPLSADEAVVVARACGLPAGVLSEADPDRLAAIVAGRDLGPPTMVQQRILEGARCKAHRDMVEKAARDVADAALRKARFNVISTEDERGVGSDLWAKAVEGDGSTLDVRVEVKGLSGHDPWATHITRSQHDAAIRDAGKGAWRLVIVTNALNAKRKEHWLSSDEGTRVFSVPERGGSVFAADRAIAQTL